jgi:hypothetical protein
MAVVFISHAHRDELLAQKLATALAAAFDLSRSDFFLSSEEGHGVAPAASILESVVTEIRGASALVVLLTPTAARSPWVWLEAGSRLGSARASAPVFVVPSERFIHLLEPMPDTRCLMLDKDGEVLELVQAVGRSLDKAPLDVLPYKPAVDDLVLSSRKLYSAAAERRARAVSWFKSHALGLLFAAAVLGALAYGWPIRWERTLPSRRETATLRQLNDAVATTAAAFLLLKGRVTSGPEGVHGAVVMVSRRDEVQDPQACREPDCTQKSTTTEGEFTIDLTKIQARKDDRVVLSVHKDGFRFFSKEIKVDVRAMDEGTAPQNVQLAAESP